MSKIKYRKRIMPSTGRMVQGSYRPDYTDGILDAERGAVPKFLKSEGGMATGTPMPVHDFFGHGIESTVTVDPDEYWLLDRDSDEPECPKVLVRDKILRTKRTNLNEITRYRERPWPGTYGRSKSYVEGVLAKQRQEAKLSRLRKRNQDELLAKQHKQALALLRQAGINPDHYPEMSIGRLLNQLDETKA